METRRRFFRSAGIGVAGIGASWAPAGKTDKSPSISPRRPMVKPRALKPGDTVGLVAPASYVFELWTIDLAVARLEALGLKTKLGKYARGRHGYMGGTEKERIEDLHAMFADPSIAGVFCLGGGYGTERLLDGLDYELIRGNSKILVGFSDITALHLAITKKAGLVTFHGPVALSSLPAWTLESFKKALFVPEPMSELTNPPEAEPLAPLFPLHTVTPGKARGITTGGNLTLISTTMGTPYEIETKGKIVFLEDTGEAPYRVDRMLTQLRLAGKLQEAAGIVWGTCTECTPAKSSFEINLSMSELLEELLGPLKIPVLAGLVFGHTKEKSTIPLGVTAELDAGAKKVAIVEAATLA